jgi:hypothetical protein
MPDQPYAVPNPTVDPADLAAEPDARWNQPLPHATRPDAKLPLAPIALTDEQGWYLSLMINNIWTRHEVWYHFHGTILKIDRPTSIRADLGEWLTTTREWDAWTSEPDATGERNMERIFSAEAWVWADSVRQIRGL